MFPVSPTFLLCTLCVLDGNGSNETFADFRARLRSTIEWIETYGYALGADHKFLHLHRQFLPYYPSLCETYLERFINTIKHRKRLEFWAPETAAHELSLWKGTEVALNALLRDFVTDVDRADYLVGETHGRTPYSLAQERGTPTPTPPTPAVPQPPAVHTPSDAEDLVSLPDPRPGSSPPTPHVDLTPPAATRSQPAPAPSPPLPPLPPFIPVTSDDSAPAPVPRPASPPVLAGVDEHRSLRVALLATAERDVSSDPARPSMRQAIGGPQSSAWLKLLKSEMHRMEENDTWELVDWAAPALAPVRETQSLLTPKFIFKSSPAVLDGMESEHDGTSTGTGTGALRQVYLSVREHAPTGQPQLLSLRGMLAALSQKRTRGQECQLYQFDYINPWLLLPLESEEPAVYVSQPHGFAVHPMGMREPVYKLRRTLYGLETKLTVPWHQLAQRALEPLGLSPVEGNPGVYFHSGYGVMVGLYVDDLVCLGGASEIHSVVAILQDRLHVRNGRPLHRLGTLEVEHHLSTMHLSQKSEIQRLLTRLGIEGADPAGVTLPPTPVSSKDLGPIPPTTSGLETWFDNLHLSESHAGVGSLPPGSAAESEISLSQTKKHWYNYVYNTLKGFAHATRPDLAYALLRLSPRARATISKEDYAALWRLLFYLKRTARLSLIIGPARADAYLSSSHPLSAGSARDSASSPYYLYAGEVQQKLHHAATTAHEHLTVHCSVGLTPLKGLPTTPAHVGGATVYLGRSLVHWYFSFLKDDPANITEASYINAAQAVYQTTHLRNLLSLACPEVHHGPLLGGNMPQLYVSDARAVADLLDPTGRLYPSSKDVLLHGRDVTIGRCYRFVRSKTFPISKDRFMDLNDVTAGSPSLARGLVEGGVKKEIFWGWRDDWGLLAPL